VHVRDRLGTHSVQRGLLVGFCEELATRGLLITGFRAAWTEPRVWFVSTLLFALLHLPNWVFGAGPIAVVQALTAFFAGSMLYLTRRVTGSLIPAMLLHGLWDFSSFIGDPAVISNAPWRLTPSSRWSWFWSCFSGRRGAPSAGRRQRSRLPPRHLTAAAVTVGASLSLSAYGASPMESAQTLGWTLSSAEGRSPR
jgi:hypothetical protein